MLMNPLLLCWGSTVDRVELAFLRYFHQFASIFAALCVEAEIMLLPKLIAFMGQAVPFRLPKKGWLIMSRAHEKTGEEFDLDKESLLHPSIFRPDLMQDQRVLVTGGGTGMGRATALLFARLGAKVAICGRRSEKLEETNALAVEATGRPMFWRAVTIRDPDAVQRFIGEVHAEFGGLDTIINNAGGQFAQNAIEFSRKGWLAVIDTNLNGTWWMMQEAAKVWRDTGKPGNIINMVANVERGHPQTAHQCAARAGVIYLSKSLAVEWAPFRIRVNCIAPGAIQTDGLLGYPGARSFWSCNPMRTLGNPFHVAEALVYLSSPAAAFINGSLHTMDGGGQQWGESWPAGRPDYFAPQSEAS